MSEDGFESLVEQRIAQLEKISERRNALLREMYQILRRRNNVGAVLTIDDEGEDDLHVFLNKCDLRANPETGYIGHLPDNELFDLVPAKPAPASASPTSSRPPSSRDKPRSRRSKSVVSDSGRGSEQPSRLSKIPEASTAPVPTPRPLVDHGDSDDELDLIGTPSARRSPSVVSIHIENTPESTQAIIVGEKEEIQEEQADVMPSEEKNIIEELPVEPIQEAKDEEEKVEEEELVQNNEQDAEAEDVHQMVEHAIKTDDTVGNTAKLSFSSSSDPVAVQKDTCQIASAEPLLKHEQDVVMEDREEEVPPIEEPTTVPPAQDDEESMVLDSSPLRPTRPLPEVSAEQAQLSAITDVPPVETAAPLVDTDDVQMDVDSEPTEQPTEAEPSASIVPIEASEPPSEPKSRQVTPVSREPSPSQPIRSSIPRLPSEFNYGTPEPIVLADPPSPVYINAPTLPAYSGFGNFDFPTDLSALHPPASPKSPSQNQPRHPVDADYPLPPVDSLPIEFSRKKRLKQQKKKEREVRKDKEKDKDGKDKDGGNDWAPWGAHRWIATIKTNPVHKKVSKATKCLTTREWSVAMQELKLLRTMDRIEMLKSTGRWSFRQPKKQRGVGGLTKTHWDYLMDEMKWMRTDFREERKWKMALAYNLSTAVLEWHAAGTLEKRLKRGICVRWKPPRQDKDHVQQQVSSSQPALDPMDLEDQDPASQDQDSSQNQNQDQNQADQSLFGLDYGSDDDDDEDQDKDQQSVGDALDTTALVEDSLEAAEQSLNQSQSQDRGLGDVGLKDLEPKKEVVDDSVSLRMPAVEMDIDMQPPTQEVKDENMDPVPSTGQSAVETETVHSGLRSSSNNPVLGSSRKSNSNSSDPSTIPQSKTSRKNLYAPLREKIAYSDVDKLFLDLDDFHITIPNPDPSGDAPDIQHLLPPADLSDIFPDLQTYTLLDVAPSGPPAEEKKPKDKRSDRDDPNKRVEEAAYTKIYPASKFIQLKPTLISALQPVNHFKDGQWVNLDETPISVEYEGMPVRITEDFSGGLFDHKMVPQIYTSALNQTLQPQNGKLREPPKRVEHQWSSNEDTILKSLADKYFNNWELIAESFNAISQTVKTDKRTSRDCQERWKERWSQDRRTGMVPETPSAVDGTPPPQALAAPPPTPNQMMTRGVKRGASTSISSPSFAGLSEPSSKKRRRHVLMQDLVRKAAKKRAEAMQKINARKPPITHESHAAYNKMPKMTPADLSRLKADRELNDQQQYQQLARARAQAQQQQQVQQSQQMQQQQQQQQQNGTQGRATPTAQVNGTAQAQPQQSATATAATGTGTTVTPPNGVARTSTSSLQTQGPGAVPQIRSQVAQVPISSQQRSNTPISAAGARLSPQQLMHLRAQQQLLVMQAQAQAQAANGTNANGTGAQATGQNGQGQVAVNMSVNVNGNGNSSMSPPYTGTANSSRDATSSPAGPHGSPPRSSATPTNANAINSPRPVPAQAQGQVQQQGQGSQGQNGNQNQSQVGGIVQMQQPQQIAALLQNGQMGIPRAANIPAHYYLPNMVQGYTPEQLQAVMQSFRVQQHAQQQQQQHQQHQQQQ